MIRLATRGDIPGLLAIVEGYAKENPIAALCDSANHNPDYVGQLLFEIILGKGFIFVDEGLTGAIIAYKTQNIWSPKLIELHELLWWVRPERRQGTVGGRLWKSFNDKAQQMLGSGQVQIICTSTSTITPPLDYTKRGYKPLSVNYFREL
jgi:hypothetical protein